MELELLLALGMFLTAILALLAGYPVALTLGGVALIFGFIGVELGLIPLPILRNLPSRILGSMENQVLIAVPLFVLMGVILVVGYSIAGFVHDVEGWSVPMLAIAAVLVVRSRAAEAPNA